MKKVFFLMSALLLTSAASVKSQVTMGSLDNPHPGAVLELKSATLGLKLPHVELDSDPTIFVLDGIEESDVAGKASATGMIVYNTAEVLCGPGVYYWDGSKWNSAWNCTPEVKLFTCLAGTFANDVSKKVTITVQDPNTLSPRDLTFLTYNLGANPALGPKAQMKYDNYDFSDFAVYGGLYQWGRKDAVHTFRCQADPDVASDPKFTDVRVANPNVGDDGTFVYNLASPYDWVSSTDPNSNLWGNGVQIGTQTTPNGFKVKDVEEYYQYPVKGSGDPCPSGWRVPTQHEWALLGHENSNPSNYTSDYFSISASGGSVVNQIAGGNPISSGLVWVPVKNGQIDDTHWESDSHDAYYNFSQISGYALYTASEWNSGKPTDDLTASGAPNPLLFLPAAGERGSLGGLYSSGANGSYWSSTVYGNNSVYLGFYGTHVGTGNYYPRTVGLSVRCVAED